MKRLLYLLQESNAPSETFIRREIKALRDNGWEVMVHSISAPDIRSEPSPNAGIASSPGRSTARPHPLFLTKNIAIQTRGRPRAAFGLLRRMNRMRSLIDAAGKCDLIHVHFAELVADMGSVIAVAANRPLTLSVHARDLFAQSKAALFARACNAKILFACTRAGKKRLIEAGLEKDKIVYAPHGLPLEEYPFHAAARPWVICGVGRFVHKKGFDLLIDAVDRLRQSGTDLSLLLIGDGPRRGALHKTARRLTEGTVEFTGFLAPDEVRHRIRHCAALVLPSRCAPDGDRDGIANVLLEAMALGTPVITTHAGAAGEAVEHERTGLLLDPESPDNIAEAVSRILTNPAQASLLAANARRKIESDFDITRNISTLIAGFEQLVGKKNR